MRRSGSLLGGHGLGGTAFLRGGRLALVDDAHNVGFFHDQQILAVDLDLGARPFAEQDEVAGLDVERNKRAVLIASAWADGDDFAFLRLFLGIVGNDDATFGFGVAFGAANDDAVVEWPEFHGSFFLGPA
jgi:hypothetical protein